MSSQPKQESAGCHGCQHFAVTYDRDWPYACEAFGMRSKRLPSVDVLEASGQPCMARVERNTTRRRSILHEPPPGGGLYV